jgi:hypothetical protein
LERDNIIPAIILIVFYRKNPSIEAAGKYEKVCFRKIFVMVEACYIFWHICCKMLNN